MNERNYQFKDSGGVELLRSLLKLNWKKYDQKGVWSILR